MLFFTRVNCTIWATVNPLPLPLPLLYNWYEPIRLFLVVLPEWFDDVVVDYEQVYVHRHHDVPIHDLGVISLTGHKRVFFFHLHQNVTSEDQSRFNFLWSHIFNRFVWAFWSCKNCNNSWLHKGDGLVQWKN